MQPEQRPDRLRLADHVIMSRQGAALLFSSDVILKFTDCSPGCTEFAGHLRAGIARADLEAKAAADTDVRDVVDALTHLGFLVADVPNPWDDEAFAAHFSYFAGIGLEPLGAQAAILKAHIVLLGVGGTGSVVLQHLVGAGVSQFTLIDPDIVEARNLNRQFIYTRHDIGRPKAESASDYVLSRVPNARVQTRKVWVRSAKDLEELDLPEPLTFFVNAADHPACGILEWVSEYCAGHDVPFVSGGCGFLEGRFGPLVPPGGASNYLRSHRLASARAKVLGAIDEPRQPVSFAPLNTVIGAMMARDVIEFLVGSTPLSLGHSVYINLRGNTITRQPIPLDEGVRR